jgi:hypothetical protein
MKNDKDKYRKAALKSKEMSYQTPSHIDHLDYLRLFVGTDVPRGMLRPFFSHKLGQA